MRPSPLAEEVTDGADAGADAAALKITRQVSARIGGECFRVMATSLRQELNADCVFIGEFTLGPLERVTTLAGCLEGGQPELTFDLAGSACSRIAATGKPVICRKNALDRFPSDQMLQRVKAEACVALPLQNPAGKPIGVLMATYRAPLASLSTAKSVLEFFAPRAAAELLHKQEKDNLHKSEQRYRAFIALNADGMWCVEFDQPIPTELPVPEQFDLGYQYGYVSECNDALARLMGVDHARQVVGRRIVDLFPKTDPAIRGASLDLIRSHYRFTTKERAIIARDGKLHFVLRSQWGIVENGMLQRIWAVEHDITEFKQVQRALDASKQRITDLLEAVQLLVLCMDPSGTIRFCNNYFTESTGWQSDALKGRNYFDLIVPEERAGLEAKLAAWVAGSTGPIHFESTLLGPDNRRWRVAWDTTVLRDEEANAKVIANIGRDITQEKEFEAQLRQAQKLESVGRLAGGVAHDCNNLLTVISGYTALLLDKLSPVDPACVELTEIQNAAAKTAQLTQQLLAFSSRRHHQPEVLNLNTLVEHDASMLGRTLGDNIELVISLDPSLGLVRADPGQISQIILNLAVNARDAMPGSGKLTIALSNASLSAESVLTVPGVPSGEYVQLTITDTGTGMTEEVLGHLFEPFFTTKGPDKGTGLGLSIVYGIVQQSGGYIKVETQLGRGTTVRVFLPRTQQEPPAAPVPPPDQKTPDAATVGGTEPILLVEDRQDVRTLTAKILRGLGYKVLEADGPSQALKIAEGHSRIDLILTDLTMPEMQGPQLAERIRQSHPEMKIAIMSGSVGREALNFPFLQKPFTPKCLASTVRHVLDHRQPLS
jgi:two-component system, cell cycle sensor histidine kinase and response regulator CckA